MNKISIECNQQEHRVNIQLTANGLREDMMQSSTSGTIEEERSVDIIQITIPEMSMQGVVITRIIVPVQETNKQASAEMVLPKIS